MYQWRGLFVEPIPEYFARLQAFYAGHDGMRFENAAIAEHDGETTMLHIPPGIVDAGTVHPAFLGMSSLIPTRNGMSSAADRPVVERYAERITVKCVTVPTLLAKHAVTQFDVLHIDVEGYDWMVLKQFDLRRYHPQVVRLEQSSLAADEVRAARELLTGAGYEVVDFYDELVGVRP
jgi:FkbM family methyltransferase